MPTKVIQITALAFMWLLLLATASHCVANDDLFTKHTAAAIQLVDRMTLAEKIGQMTQAELTSLGDLSDIRRLALGSVLSGGGADPDDGNSLAAWAAAYEACQQQAVGSRLGVPILYGVDAVHGHGNVLGAVVFPHNIGLGCTRNADLVEEVNRITAREVRASGMNFNFAPCVAVPRDDRWGRTYEGFSEHPGVVAELGAAAVRGLQGSDLRNTASVLGCAKHFVGDGATAAEVRLPDWEGFGAEKRLRLDQGDARIDEPTLRRLHVRPYVDAINEGVGAVMPSYSTWNGVRCSASHQLLTELLKGELGFTGIVISDYNAIDQISDDYKLAIKTSVNAGMDMFMVPQKYERFINLLTELVNQGQVPVERINDAATRIVRVKIAMGLLDQGFSVEADPQLASEFGSDVHRTVAREAVRQSLVLLRNQDGALPLNRQQQRIHVAGRAADDIGVQCGGWTIEWQGAEGEVTPGGTTILAALRKAVGDRVTYNPAGHVPDDAEVAVVVVGESPYAEGAGDDADLALSKGDRQLVQRVAESGVPTVLVLLSGRPLILDGLEEHCEAVVAAWLPGTEGAGVADVLLGDYQPSGQLSFTWPRNASQHPINVGDADADPLYPFGHGLSY